MSVGFEKAQTVLNTVKEESEMEYIYMVYFPNPDDPEQMAYVLNAYTERELQEAPDTINSLGDPCGEGDFEDSSGGVMLLFRFFG